MSHIVIIVDLLLLDLILISHLETRAEIYLLFLQVFSLQVSNLLLTLSDFTYWYIILYCTEVYGTKYYTKLYTV